MADVSSETSLTTTVDEALPFPLKLLQQQNQIKGGGNGRRRRGTVAGDEVQIRPEAAATGVWTDAAHFLSLWMRGGTSPPLRNPEPSWSTEPCLFGCDKHE